MTALWLYILAMVLAFFLGFSTHRASLCSVRAVAEVMHTGKPRMFISFVKIVLWTLLVLLIFMETIPGIMAPSDAYAITLTVVVAGFLFGIGVAINEACAVSTLTRLADGQIGFLATFAGFVLGIIVVAETAYFGLSLKPTSVMPFLMPGDAFNTYLLIGLGIWAVWEFRRIIKTWPKEETFFKACLSPAYRLSFAAFIIGISNAVIETTFGNWSYTAAINAHTSSILAGSPIGWEFGFLLFFSLLGGMLLSSRHMKRFSFERPTLKASATRFFGGTLMGLAIGIIPGGNETLMLDGIPRFSTHAIPTLIAVFIGVYVVLIIRRKLGKKIQVVDCTGDVCVIVEK